MNQIKNPYHLPDHHAAFEQALDLLRFGLDHWQVSRSLDPALPRNVRRNIAAKAARSLYWQEMKKRKELK